MYFPAAVDADYGEESRNTDPMCNQQQLYQ